MIVWSPIFHDFSKNPMTRSNDNPSNELLPARFLFAHQEYRANEWNYALCQESLRETLEILYTKKIPPPHKHTHTQKHEKNTHILRSHIVFTNWGILHDLPCIGIYHDLRGFRPRGFLANVAQGRAPMARFMPGVLGSLGSGVWGRFSNGWVVP